jgi:hypothetical protein
MSISRWCKLRDEVILSTSIYYLGSIAIERASFADGSLVGASDPMR